MDRARIAVGRPMVEAGIRPAEEVLAAQAAVLLEAETCSIGVPPQEEDGNLVEVRLSAHHSCEAAEQAQGQAPAEDRMGMGPSAPVKVGSAAWAEDPDEVEVYEDEHDRSVEAWGVLPQVA